MSTPNPPDSQTRYAVDDPAPTPPLYGAHLRIVNNLPVNDGPGRYARRGAVLVAGGLSIALMVGLGLQLSRGEPLSLVAQQLLKGLIGAWVWGGTMGAVCSVAFIPKRYDRSPEMRELLALFGEKDPGYARALATLLALLWCAIGAMIVYSLWQ